MLSIQLSILRPEVKIGSLIALQGGFHMRRKPSAVAGPLLILSLIILFAGRVEAGPLYVGAWSRTAEYVNTLTISNTEYGAEVKTVFRRFK